MRITDRMVINHTISQLQQERQRLGDAQTRVATGRRLLRSSDNPADVERAMTLGSELATVQNQAANLDTTRDWLNGTEAALGNFNDLMIRARNLALKASNSTNSEDELAAIASEADGVLQNALAIANTSQGGYYLFAGQQVRTAPFKEESNAIAYQGDNREMRHPVELGQTMPVNISGVAGDHGGLLNGLTQLKALQQALTANDQNGVQDFLRQSESVNKDVYISLSTVGARIQRIDRTASRLQQRDVELRQLYSNLVDADMATTISEMNAEQQAYETALAASARAIPRSLLDYLR